MNKQKKTKVNRSMNSNNLKSQSEPKKEYNNSIVLTLWNAIFQFLEYLSLFQLIRFIYKILNKNDEGLGYRFVECWVIFNLVAAITSSILMYFGLIKIASIIIVTYGMLRIFEIVIYQINVLIFHPYRAQLRSMEYKIKSPTRIVVLLFHNYFEII